ncbi:amidohydrolase [Microbacterium tumbae]
MTPGASIGTLRAVRIAGPGAEFLIDEEPVDVFIEDGLITDIAPTGALPVRGGVLDAAGGWAIPGLWDGHVHVVQWALAAERASVADAGSAEETARRMAAVAPRGDGRRIGIGYRDALWSDVPSLAVLDAATGEVPTYLVNADVHSVWLNSAALRRESRTSPDGMLREDDAFEITRRLDAVDDVHGDLAVARAGAQAAARGVTGLVDFDMAWSASSWSRRTRSGFAAHRVEFATYPDDLDRAIAAGLRSGAILDGTGGLVRVGPLKIITDGSLGTRTAACSHAYAGTDSSGALNVAPEHLIELMTRATGAGLDVAAHAIGDVAAASALDAFALSGARGTIEHAQLIRHADVVRMARLGIAASVQPRHAVDDRDLADRLWRAQTSLGYPMRSLQDAGVELRLGSDAPVAPLDPWLTIAAAVARTAGGRAAWHPEEALTPGEAIRASVRGELRPGSVADIAVLGADPLSASAEELRTMPVQATVLGGRLTHGA